MVPIVSVETKQSEGMTFTLEKKAVILLSGGVDSTVTAYIAKQDIGRGGQLYALSFRYGQLHAKEQDCYLEQSRLLGIREHLSLDLPIFRLTSSSLTGHGEIPTKESEGIPSTWVPQRNSVFLALAFAYAETVGADRVYIGVNSRDYSGYPDCRPVFIYRMEEALNLASKRYVEAGKRIGIIAPLQYWSKVEIIRKGIELGVDFSRTWSCYRGGELACGRCPSCRIRREAFASLGIDDPIQYEVTNPGPVGQIDE